jgi:predicted MPP superfamily phosphohydrolase
MHVSRRELLKWSTSSLLAANLWPGALAASDTPTKDFPFIVVNDLHYVDHECGHFLQDTVVRMMKATEGGIEFVLVVGDLTEHGKPEQEATVKDILNTLGVPYFVVPGNHDWNATTERKPYEQLYPKQTNYLFDHNGVQFVALDTTDKGKFKDVAASADTLAWLKDNLPKLDKSKPTILYTHFPLSHWTFYHLTNNDAILDAFRDYNLKAVYNGHFHGFTEESVRGIPVVTNKCCALKRANHDFTKSKGYFHCNWKDGKVVRTFVEVPMPQAATQPAKEKA